MLDRAVKSMNGERHLAPLQSRPARHRHGREFRLDRPGSTEDTEQISGTEAGLLAWLMGRSDGATLTGTSQASSRPRRASNTTREPPERVTHQSATRQSLSGRMGRRPATGRCASRRRARRCRARSRCRPGRRCRGCGSPCGRSRRRTVTPFASQRGQRLAQLVVAVADLEAEVVEPDAATRRHGPAASAPTSMSSSSWWVRPDGAENAATGTRAGRRRRRGGSGASRARRGRTRRTARGRARTGRGGRAP